MGKMHADEIDIDVALVRRLLTAQFPAWAELPLAPVRSAGTDNAMYRLGADMAVRLPRIGWAVGQVETELRWLPRLAPHLPLAIPEPLAMGNPGEGYPWHWGVYRWLAGENATIERIGDPNAAAVSLAGFITALERIDPAVGPPVWIHGDLQSGNLLAQRGRLSAVIDWGCMGIGDPACDLMPAWNLFTAEARAIFRKALAVDDATWARGRGWALSCGLIALPYYKISNPVLAGIARHAIGEVLAEHWTR